MAERDPDSYLLYSDAPSSGGDRRTIVARHLRRLRDDSGAATAEYAIATLAAVGLAGLLVAILRGDEVRSLLTDVIRRALSAGQ